MLLATSVLGSVVPSVLGAGHGGHDHDHDHEKCVPSLEIEIALPAGADVTEKFGETDHYLAANVDTVTWGYYDPNATAAISMESGETITVEVITHHSGHDYAKMIKGDPAIEEVFFWEAEQTLLDKPEPKLPGSGVHLITGPIEVKGEREKNPTPAGLLAPSIYFSPSSFPLPEQEPSSGTSSRSTSSSSTRGTTRSRAGASEPTRRSSRGTSTATRGPSATGLRTSAPEGPRRSPCSSSWRTTRGT